MKSLLTNTETVRFRREDDSCSVCLHVPHWSRPQIAKHTAKNKSGQRSFLWKYLKTSENLATTLLFLPLKHARWEGERRCALLCSLLSEVEEKWMVLEKNNLGWNRSCCLFFFFLCLFAVSRQTTSCLRLVTRFFPGQHHINTITTTTTTTTPRLTILPVCCVLFRSAELLSLNLRLMPFEHLPTEPLTGVPPFLLMELPWLGTNVGSRSMISWLSWSMELSMSFVRDLNSSSRLLLLLLFIDVCSLWGAAFLIRSAAESLVRPCGSVGRPALGRLPPCLFRWNRSASFPSSGI